MRFIFTFIFAILSVNIICCAQSADLPLGSEEHYLLDRLETTSGDLSDQLFLTIQPVNRKAAVQFLMNERNNFVNRDLSNVDNYNMVRAISISGEWSRNYSGMLRSRKPLFGTLYQFQPDFIQVNNEDVYLSLNPIFSLGGIYENSGTRDFRISSTQGLAIRARISNVVGLNFNFTHNYEEPASYYAGYVQERLSFPGAPNYKRRSNGYEYLLINASADFALIKDHVNVTVGYDRHFIGDGINTLFLSNFSSPVPFVKLNTRIWKLNYENLYMAVKPQFPSDTAFNRGAHKYVTMHHLSANITRWLNIGLFESVTFSRDGGFEIGYMNPIIFYRALERSKGSPDKVALGINAKALPIRSLQLYGQFLLNEFTAKEFFDNNGYMHNKWGAQLGFKYFNAFTIDNLDIQGEFNIVRPYTYQHATESNFSNNNLPLAHPLGAGFRQVLGDLRYQPIPRLLVNARAMFYQEGVDTAGINYGNDVTRSYREGQSSYGVHVINGEPAQCILLGVNASYELWPNLFFDLGGTYRNYTAEDSYLGLNHKTWFINAGMRLNLTRRSYWEF